MNESRDPYIKDLGGYYKRQLSLLDNPQFRTSLFCHWLINGNALRIAYNTNSCESGLTCFRSLNNDGHGLIASPSVNEPCQWEELGRLTFFHSFTVPVPVTSPSFCS
jgi:hypothetical protein